MLKKVVIGILCFIILAVTGVGIYVYTLDWNKHKSIVAHRLSQITGLNAKIDGNLSIEIFPKPKFSAGLVKFTKGNSKTPLIEVNDISANVELFALINNEFVLKNMSLTNAEVHLFINEKGEANWGGVNKAGKNKSGNIEVSFKDIKVTGSSIIYEDKKNNKKFTIPNISANISAPSLKGPYKTNGKFIHNKKEISFNGNIENNKNIKIKMSLNSAAIGSKFSIDGTIGENPAGNIIFDSKNLYTTIVTMFGENSISNVYNEPIYVSFTYGKDKDVLNLNNFNIKYGNDTIGNGLISIAKDEKWNISSDIDMSKFNLNILENIGIDLVDFSKNVKEEKKPLDIGMDINIKSDNASYNGAAAHKLNMGIAYNNGVIDINRFAVTMPGETSIKSIGKITTAPKLEYIFNNTVESKDIKTFASLFNINLTKNASKDNKKSIFQRTQAEFMISGDANAIKVSFAKALIDNTNMSGNLGFVFNEDKTHVIVQADLEKILFDKYIDLSPLNNEKQTFKDKLLYQINLSPWKGNFETDAIINIKNAIYNNIAIDNLYLKFIANENKLNVEDFKVESLGGANVNVKADIDNPYVNPSINELSYSVNTTNFPSFATSIGLDTGSYGIFRRKIFASQGIINGSINQFNMSSIQKFGDAEISYTGLVSIPKDGHASFDGDIELKTNNFVNFAHSIGFTNYKPDIPVTTFTLNAKLLGSFNLFEMSNINAYLGANNIQGLVRIDNTEPKSKVFANIDFDKFNVNNMLNIDRKPEENLISTTNAFIDKIEFSNEKIDLSFLQKLDFDLTTNIKQLIWNNTKYANLKASAVLNNGTINVKKFSVQKNESSINLDFILESNNLAKIMGNYNISKYYIPPFGGKIYRIEKAFITSKGSFSSNLLSEKSFYDNLNAKGSYNLSNVTIGGWDLDIIKFELEQSASVKNLTEVIENNLKMGKTLFNKASGKYEFSKGIFISDNSVLSSPVENVDVKLNLDLSNWQMVSDYSIFYNNASFSDVVKFSLFGDISNLDLKINIDDSIERVKDIEKRISTENEDKKKQKMGFLQDKVVYIQKDIDKIKQNIDRMSFDFIRFKPTSDNLEVKKSYELLQAKLKEIENNIKKLEKDLIKSTTEKDLMDLEAKIAKETSKILYLPKSLEENFIVESKYIFDRSFSKLSWLFNLAQSNSSYYKSLVDIYMKQIEILESTGTPVAEETIIKLKDDVKKISDDMDKINVLHGKIGDNYLNIIDSNNLNDMNRNNDMVTQALHTMLSYIKQLNDNIINSIDVFRSVLDIQARDYDTFLVYPPETIDEIDINTPITKQAVQNSVDNSVDEKKTKLVDKEEFKDPEKLEKQNEMKVSLNSFANGISSLFEKLGIKNKQNIQPSKNSGIKDVVNNIGEINTIKEAKEPVIVAEVTKETKEPVVIAEATKEAKEPVVVAEATKEVKEPVVVAEVTKEAKEPVVVAEATKEVKEPVVVAEATKEVKEPVVVAEVTKEAKEPVIVAEVTKEAKEPVIVAEATKEAKEPVVVAEVTKEAKEPVVIAEVTKEAKEPVVVAEATKEAKEPVVVAEVTKEAKEQVVVAEIVEPKDEINQIKVDPIVISNDNIIDKAKLALSNIISDISIKEETVLNDIKHQEVIENAENNSNTLKVNPVIAMNIGKADLIQEKATVIPVKRRSFYNKNTKDENNNKTVEESIVNEEKQEKIIAEQTKQNFLKLFANSNDNFKRNVDINTSEVVRVYKNENNKENNTSLYVFAGTSNIKSSGDVGKSFLVGKTLPKPIKNTNKYIFASNNVDRVEFSGNVGKKVALSVK